MTLTINGQERDFSSKDFTVFALLEALGLGGKPVVVELDQEAVFPADYPSTAVRDGAAVEIVVIAAGG